LGTGNPFYGKNHDEITKETISEWNKKNGRFKKGHKLGFKKGQMPWNTGKHHSEETKKKLSEKAKQQWIDGRASREFLFRGGERHQCWKGGISSKEFRRQQREQNAGRPMPKMCDVCSEEKSLFFDHDHKTGKFRGWLCSHCNFALGHAKDSPELLFKLIEYLKKNAQP